LNRNPSLTPQVDRVFFFNFPVVFSAQPLPFGFLLPPPSVPVGPSLRKVVFFPRITAPVSPLHSPTVSAEPSPYFYPFTPFLQNPIPAPVCSQPVRTGAHDALISFFPRCTSLSGRFFRHWMGGATRSSYGRTPQKPMSHSRVVPAQRFIFGLYTQMFNGPLLLPMVWDTPAACLIPVETICGTLPLFQFFVRFSPFKT